jgi:hypothetical protein
VILVRVSVLFACNNDDNDEYSKAFTSKVEFAVDLAGKQNRNKDDLVGNERTKSEKRKDCDWDLAGGEDANLTSALITFSFIPVAIS